MLSGIIFLLHRYFSLHWLFAYTTLYKGLARKNMDVNEHKRLSNITLRHKLK